ncbi:MAG: histidine kinase, partial [Cyclobacteriaceae bacterium]
YSYLNILFTEGDKLFGFRPNPVLFFGIILVMVFLIWEGNRWLEQLIQSLLPKWHQLLKFFLFSLILVLIISLATTLFIQSTQQITAESSLTFKLTLGFSFRVNLFLHSINAIVFFMNKNKQNELEKQTLLKDTAEARFSALRNQINPHFLFNSFNVLSTLVHKDPDTASRFIEQMSKVYRYLLNNQKNRVVTLEQELEFLDAYIYLLQIRFGDNLQIENELRSNSSPIYIAPATLQMLIENAIKHNVVSKANPLRIRMFQDEKSLIVENDIQRKTVNEESTQTGLRNIRQRYNFLCGENAVIVQSNGKFTVRIPKINIEDESIGG